jgi:LacI family transcriptional regulator
VSIATVSRALNGADEVGEETRQRIVQLAAELDYAPSAAARTLVTRRSHVFGVALGNDAGGPPGLQHPFFQDVLVGLQDEAGAQGFDLLLFARDRTASSSAPTLLNRCRHHGVDGVVLIALDLSGPEIDTAPLPGIPCVAIDEDVQSAQTAQISSDNIGGAALATRHLHELGHRRIAMITGPERTKAGRERLAGYRQELERVGVPLRPEYVQHGHFFSEGGAEAMSALLGLSEPPTGVFASSDLMAAGALQRALELGARVPEDVSIIGFDDLQLTSLTQPTLSTVRQDKHGIGAAAARALSNMLKHPDAEPPVITLPVSLVRRESTGQPPASRPRPRQQRRSSTRERET